MLEVVVELGLKAGIGTCLSIGGLDGENERRQCLGGEEPPVDAKRAPLVRPAAEGVRDPHPGPHPSAWAAARKARILLRSFSPGRLSTPEDTSTALAPEMRTASGNISAVNPPDSIHSQRQDRPAIRSQSKARPLPPGNAPRRRGGLASNSSKSATSS